jgi:hypothetical protein
MQDSNSDFVRCSYCSEVFNRYLEHNHDEIWLAIDVEVEQCINCIQWFAAVDMETKGWCHKCFSRTPWAKSESYGLLGQRVSCYGYFSWFSEESLDAIESFAAKWLASFPDKLDKNILAMLFHSRITPTNYIKHVPSPEELNQILKGAFLPFSASEVEKLQILRAWLQDFNKDVLIEQIDTQLETQSRALRQSELRTLIWGLDEGELMSLKDLRVSFGAEAKELFECLVETQKLVLHNSEFPQVNLLNLERDKNLKHYSQ